MFSVVQFIVCLMGFVGCLAVIAFIAFVFNDLKSHNVFEGSFLILCMIVLCLIAVVFCFLSMIEVTVS